MNISQIIIEREDAILAPYDARDEVALLIGIRHTLLVNHRLCRSREITPYIIQTRLDFSDFIEGYRCSGIALDTTLALTDTKVTTEFLRQDL